MSFKAPIPTLGYASQKAAIIALYEQRIEPTMIAARTGAPVKSVHRAIHDYRQATGRMIAPERARQPNRILAERWGDDEHKRRLAAHERAVKGARLTMQAAGL